MTNARSDAVEVTTLGSGVVVVTERMADVRSVTTGVWVDVGSRDETDTEAGSSHFLEHLAFKGTATRSARDIAETVDSMGGDMNAYTTKEYTAFHVRTLDEDAAEGLAILCDIVGAPSLRSDEVASEQRVILEEINMRADEPDELMHELLHEARFPGHPLGRDIAGSAATVSAMSADTIRAFHIRTYVPGCVVVACAGLIDHEQVVAQVEATLALPVGPGRLDRCPPTVESERLRVGESDTEQIHLGLALGGLDRFHPDRYALGVVDHVLGGGMSSRLFQEIREERGLAYSVYSYRSPYADAGFMGIGLGTAPGHLLEVLDLVHKELERLCADGLTDDEISRAKRSIRGGSAMALEDTGSRMARIGRSQLLMGTVPTLDEVLALTEAVTREDCARVVEACLALPRTLAMVGPVEANLLVGHPVLG